MVQRTRRQFLQDSMLAAAAVSRGPDVQRPRPRPGHESQRQAALRRDRLQRPRRQITSASTPAARMSRSPTSSTSTRRWARRPATRSRNARAAGRSGSRTCARSSTTSPSTSSRRPRRTIGTPCAASGPCRPARTPTSRSRSATTFPKGAALVAAAKKYGRICQVGTQCRSNPAIQNAVKFMADGGIGQVNFARGLCYKRRKSIGALGDYPIPAEVDFDLWSGPAPYTHAQAHPAEPALRLALAAALRQRRLGQPGPSSDRHRPLGTGHQPPSQQRDRLRRSAGLPGRTQGPQLRRCRRHGQHGSRHLRLRRQVHRLRDPRPVRGRLGRHRDQHLFGSTKGNKIGVIFYGTEGYLVQREYTHCVAYDLKGR